MHSLPGIKNSVVLYTGAGGLIGSAACIELAKQGAKLALLDPNIESLKKISDAIRNIDPELPHSIHGNINTLNSDSIDQCLTEIESKLGPIDCLISSAYPRTADWHLKFEKIPMESWQKNVDDHLNSYFLMGQRCAVKMMLRGKGNIIFFSSITAFQGHGLMYMTA